MAIRVWIWCVVLLNAISSCHCEGDANVNWCFTASDVPNRLTMSFLKQLQPFCCRYDEEVGVHRSVDIISATIMQSVGVSFDMNTTDLVKLDTDLLTATRHPQVAAVLQRVVHTQGMIAFPNSSFPGEDIATALTAINPHGLVQRGATGHGHIAGDGVAGVVDSNEKKPFGNQFHFDCSEGTPCAEVLLLARVVRGWAYPTSFVHTCDLYDALPVQTQHELRHSYWMHSKSQRMRPLLSRHPFTGRTCISLHLVTLGGVVLDGRVLSKEEVIAYALKLKQLLIDAETAYNYEEGDALLASNLSGVHRAKVNQKQVKKMNVWDRRVLHRFNTIGYDPHSDLDLSHNFDGINVCPGKVGCNHSPDEYLRY